jgi:hypothetical protein
MRRPVDSNSDDHADELEREHATPIFINRERGFVMTGISARRARAERRLSARSRRTQ